MTDEILNGRTPAGDARLLAALRDEPESPDYPAWLDDDCGACGAPRDGAYCTRCEGDA